LCGVLFISMDSESWLTHLHHQCGTREPRWIQPCGWRFRDMSAQEMGPKRLTNSLGADKHSPQKMSGCFNVLCVRRTRLGGAIDNLVSSRGHPLSHVTHAHEGTQGLGPNPDAMRS